MRGGAEEGTGESGIGRHYPISRRAAPCGGLVVLTGLLLLALACGGSAPGEGSSGGNAPREHPPESATGNTPRSPGSSAPETGPLIVFLGDSLTAGLGLPGDLAYPAVIGERLSREGTAVRIVNAGVSGDTTAGGLSRVDWLLRQRPDILVIGLGANDGLRGQPLENAESNLRAIISRARAAGARVLLLGMRIPTNYGPDYTAAFSAMYPRIARTENVALVPFLLEGVGGRAELNLADGLHPNARGQQIVAENVLRVLRPMLTEIAAAA